MPLISVSKMAVGECFPSDFPVVLSHRMKGQEGQICRPVCRIRLGCGGGGANFGKQKLMFFYQNLLRYHQLVLINTCVGKLPQHTLEVLSGEGGARPEAAEMSQDWSEKK